MQKPRKSWVISGMTARVAAANQFVTNYHKGGHAEPLSKTLLLLFNNNKRKVDATLRRIARLSYIIAKTISKRHSFRELGIDFGIEKNGRIWIIEANSKPGHMLFTQLRNKKMLRNIMKNKRLISKRDSS
jgi:glutathione synthase/RimK-type ligase-like ATP-grasp enzyme